MNYREIAINASKSYKVIVGDNLLSNVAEFVKEVYSGETIALVYDRKVKLFAQSIIDKLQKSFFTVYSYESCGGEESKTKENLFDILDFFIDNKINRKNIVISVGGGALCDVVGLAAALYMRGVDYIQIPTTLLAMVDASVGGKTAVNTSKGKNLIGAFWQPKLVLCDSTVLDAIPEELIKQGMSEIIKYNIISEATHTIKDVINNDIDFNRTLFECVSIKGQIVEEDEFEKSGKRILLNAGHTVAHAIEENSKFQISHGEAVGQGLVLEAAISTILGYCSIDTFNIIRKAVECVWGKICIDNKPDLLAQAMLVDKKNTDNTIKFVLPETIGCCQIVSLSEEQVIETLNSTQMVELMRGNNE